MILGIILAIIVLAILIKFGGIVFKVIGWSLKTVIKFIIIAAIIFGIAAAICA